MSKPLKGIRIVEMAGIGPGPHGTMVLADLGADVVRVDRATGRDGAPEGAHHTLRGRRVVSVDLKNAADRDSVLELISSADVLVEGFRPGVMERLGLGPDECLEVNPRLVYARMSGWGQTGPLAPTAGHDINYIALTGALNAIGTAERPIPPLNLVGDYGGGSMFLVTGILAALIERHTSGRGQVIDVAMVDGASALIQPILEWRLTGLWRDGRESNLLDGASPFYRTYLCSDGRFVAVGAVEPQFYEVLVTGLGLQVAALPSRDDPSNWAEIADRFAAVFATRSRDEWAAHFAGTDACVTPVLAFEEAPDHAHMRARAALEHGLVGVVANPAPRFSRSTGNVPAPATYDDLSVVLSTWTSALSAS